MPSSDMGTAWEVPAQDGPHPGGVAMRFDGTPWLEGKIFSPSATGPRLARYADVPSLLVAGRPLERPPLISIVIPTFRRPELLRQTIASALGQVGGVEFDVIVVDNDGEAPEDGETARAVASFDDPRLYYFRNARNIGLEGNFNRTIDIGRGRFVCQLHDDDWLGPHYLERMVARLPQDAELISAGQVDGVEDYRPDFPWPRTPGLPRVRRLKPLDVIHSINSIAPALMLRSAFLEIGGYDGGLYPVLDYALYGEFVRRGKAYKIYETLSYLRTTDSVTYKGDTYERQITGTLDIKRQYLGHAPRPLGALYYVESMRRQFDRTRMLGKPVTPFVTTRLDRWADRLSRQPAFGRMYGSAMTAVRGLLNRF